jgi:Secretion system C-terminal sorting domain/PKD-like domain
MKKNVLLACLACSLAWSAHAQSVSLSTTAADGSQTQNPVTVPFCTTQSFTGFVSIPTGSTSNNICGVQWNVNGTIYSGGAAPGSTLVSFSIPITTASVHVAVTVYLGPSGCSFSTPVTSNTIDITGLAQDIHIDGPLQVCTAPQTFTVRNLPSGTPISWAVSSNLQIISGQSTPTIQVEQLGTTPGTGNVSATVGAVCGVTPAVQNLGVTVGLSTPTGINGFSPLESFAPNTAFPFSTDNNTGTDWRVSGGSILSGQGTSFIIVQTVNVASGFVPFEIDVRQNNACGVSPYFSVEGKVQAGGTGPHVIMGPNPASGMVTLYAPVTETAVPATGTKMATADTRVPSAGASAAGSSNLPTIRLIKIYDVSGRLRKTIDNKTASLPLQLDVSDLANGIYFVEMVIGSNTERQKLVIQH